MLNKADSLDPAELLKINSALTWSLSRILTSPEPRRIYTGSFWDQPLKPTYLNELFEKESLSLLTDLNAMPRNNVTNKVNDLVSRVRRVKVHASRLKTLTLTKTRTQTLTLTLSLSRSRTRTRTRALRCKPSS